MKVTILFLLIFTPLTFANSFLLKCENIKKEDSYKSLYFFNKVNRFTGYFVFTNPNKRINVFQRKCSTDKITTDKYMFNCKGGDYKFQKDTENKHYVYIERKDLSLNRLFIANFKYTGTSFWGDDFRCNIEDLEIAKTKLKDMRKKIKERDKILKNEKSTSDAENKI